MNCIQDQSQELDSSLSEQQETLRAIFSQQEQVLANTNCIDSTSKELERAKQGLLESLEHMESFMLENKVVEEENETLIFANLEQESLNDELMQQIVDLESVIE